VQIKGQILFSLSNFTWWDKLGHWVWETFFDKHMSLRCFCYFFRVNCWNWPYTNIHEV